MFFNVILAKCFNQVDNGQKETSMLPFQYYFFLFLRYCSFSARRLLKTLQQLLLIHDMFTSLKVAAMDHKQVFQGSVWTVVGCLELPSPLEKRIFLMEGAASLCTDVPPSAGKIGAAVHRLGWSKPIQCDSVITLQYETNDLFI